MKTIAICTFLSFVALLAVGVLGLQWLDAQFGQVAVIVMVAFVAVALFVVVIMVLLSLFTLAQSRIYANTIRDTADVNLANARNVGKMLSASRGAGSSREPEQPMIDAQWWDAGAPAQLPEPHNRFAAIGGAVRKLLPGSTETPMEQALPLQRRNRRQPAMQDWGDDQEYGDRLIVQ